jgi:hypothetical protein
MSLSPSLRVARIIESKVLIKDECRRIVGERREDAGAVAKAVIRPSELMMRPGETTKLVAPRDTGRPPQK